MYDPETQPSDHLAVTRALVRVCFDAARYYQDGDPPTDDFALTLLYVHHRIEQVGAPSGAGGVGSVETGASETAPPRGTAFVARPRSSEERELADLADYLNEAADLCEVCVTSARNLNPGASPALSSTLLLLQHRVRRAAEEVERREAASDSHPAFSDTAFVARPRG